MPAMSNISFMGGMDFIRPETKPAVAVLPSFCSPPSQTVTLSILMPLTASTWMRMSSSILSASIRRTAWSASPPAAATICRRPSACLTRISWAPWASASILARMASASPLALAADLLGLGLGLQLPAALVDLGLDDDVGLLGGLLTGGAGGLGLLLGGVGLLQGLGRGDLLGGGGDAGGLGLLLTALGVAHGHLHLGGVLALDGGGVGLGHLDALVAVGLGLADGAVAVRSATFFLASLMALAAASLPRASM